MSDFSFDINNSLDLYNKLLEDYEEFTKGSISSRLAINCAMTAWHLVDWIYHEYADKSRYSSIGKYQAEMKSKCPSLQIMQDITNGSKHLLITKYPSKVRKTNLHKGAFQNDAFQNNAFDTTMFEIEMQDGTKLKFEDEIEKVIDFWKIYLTTELHISI